MWSCVLTKLLINVAEVLGISEEHVHAWTDSSIVLAWLDGQPRQFKTYVANRVSFVLQATSPQTWRHVPTAENPADCASRGMMPKELLDHELWWTGPDWLLQEPIQVPKQPPRRALAPPEQRTFHINVLQSALALRIEERSNNYHTVLSITAWCFRLFHRIKDGRPDPDTRGRHLTVQEIKRAEHWLLRQSQARSFPKERRALLREHNISTSSRLKSLAPVMDEEHLLRVGGRLSNSSLTRSQQHPIIADSKDSLIIMYFKHMHVSLGHCGPSLSLCATESRFHVVGTRRLTRDVCSQCKVCRKAAPKANPQLLGELPAARVTSTVAFTNTGIDFAGPFILKKGHTRKPVKIKAYVCVFICMSTKAVHLEVVSDMTTPAFLASLRRFISRRNCPSNIYSDNGSNFIGARNELRDLYKFLEEEETDSAIRHYLLQHRVDWNNIPERAPHFGGLWESAVKSMKMHLKRIMGLTPLTFEEMETVTCQVEACLNSRPIIPMTSHNPDGLSTLTAGHFLLFKPPMAYPEDPRLPEEPSLLKKWNVCQAMVQHFWSRWSKEYLNTLQARTKWQKSRPNLQVDDVVILKEDRTFACHWPLAKIIQTYPGKDGLVRVARVKTATGEYKRPVTKLALLHREESSQDPSTMALPPGVCPGSNPDQTAT